MGLPCMKTICYGIDLAVRNLCPDTNDHPSQTRVEALPFNFKKMEKGK